MSYKLNDIRNLRIVWTGSYSANGAHVAFESGTERFHIHLYTAHNVEASKLDEGTIQFSLKSTLYANDIEQPRYGYRGARQMDLSKPTHAKLRELIYDRFNAKYGSISAAARKAGLAYAADDAAKEAQRRADLANSIREQIDAEYKKVGSPVATGLFHALADMSDDALIALRGAMYNAKYPDIRENPPIAELEA